MLKTSNVPLARRNFVGFGCVFFFLSFLFSSLFFCIYLFLVLPDIPGGWLAKVEAYFGVFELVMSHVQRSTEFKPDSS